jgi:hypothetical protein
VTITPVASWAQLLACQQRRRDEDQVGRAQEEELKMGFYSYSVIETNDEGQLIRLPGYNGAGAVG